MHIPTLLALTCAALFWGVSAADILSELPSPTFIPSHGPHEPNMIPNLWMGPSKPEPGGLLCGGLDDEDCTQSFANFTRSCPSWTLNWDGQRDYLLAKCRGGGTARSPACGGVAGVRWTMLYLGSVLGNGNGVLVPTADDPSFNETCSHCLVETDATIHCTCFVASDDEEDEMAFSAGRSMLRINLGMTHVSLPSWA
ncbi:hypothetical protein VTK73DRAFT_323 [Phialemonium thermophilum]|uniref:Cyanovirin-N domain-containing protein n=1 Tax=Phialemonium thermophilum TaxID=223376 RepID=A0ABR3VVQ4_9PEZI